jgi:Flp pilus assembly protein TadD
VVLRQDRFSRLLHSAAVVALMGAMAGCSTVRPTATTAPVGAATQAASGPGDTSQARRELDAAAEQYQARPRDGNAAIRYAQALRETGQRSQAAAVLEQASIQNPKNKAVLGAYGRALADAGNFGQAFEVLSRAHTPDRPDWRILSVQGAALDQMGRHDEARRYYSSALKIMPDEPSVLSNLGLSYALTKELPQAESTLRRAASKDRANARVRQNLALVIGLQGRFEEAEAVARADLPPEEAAANAAYLRELLARQPGPRKRLPSVAQGR